MIQSAGMMLAHLHEASAAARLAGAIDDVLRRAEVRTRDLGGTATTEEMATAVATAVRDRDLRD
jgi:isocitrate/isopropylmalate dehydrogenase